MKRSFLILLLAGLLAGCDSETLADVDPPFTGGTVQIADFTPSDLEGDTFELIEARIDGQTLLLDVAYSGGCAEHEFGGLSPSVVILIHPAQLSVYVMHDGNGDLCEAYIHNTVSLDISTLLASHGGEFDLTVVPVNSNSDDITLRHRS
ncbi:MAG: hypothetical protein OXT73_09445 [Bacteroidota bacterium]|nr:hypothetical protein [Bacteroidota bacterium]